MQILYIVMKPIFEELIFLTFKYISLLDKPHNLLLGSLCHETITVCLVSFLFFLGLHPRHVEVPRLGVKSELQLPAYTTATATADMSRVCDYTTVTATPDP